MGRMCSANISSVNFIVFPSNKKHLPHHGKATFGRCTTSIRRRRLRPHRARSRAHPGRTTPFLRPAPGCIQPTVRRVLAPSGRSLGSDPPAYFFPSSLYMKKSYHIRFCLSSAVFSYLQSCKKTPANADVSFVVRPSSGSSHDPHQSSIPPPRCAGQAPCRCQPPAAQEYCLTNRQTLPD